MRILMLSPGGNQLGGAERSLALLIEGLVATGHDVHVLVLAPGGAAKEFRRCGATVHGPDRSLTGAPRHGGTVPFLAAALRSAPRAIAVAARIRRLARRLDVDLIHSNGFRTHVLSPLVRPGGRPVVWSLRDVPPSDVSRRLLGLASRSAAGVAANSAFTAASLEHGHVRTVANPIAVPARFDADDARRRLRLPSGRPIVSVVAHLHPSKGQQVAVEAWRTWPGDRPLLVLAGGDLYGRASTDHEAALRALVADAGLEHDVAFSGPVEDVGLVYSASDVVLVPAIHPEGFGRVAAEAQAAGVPVIASASGGLLEIITDRTSGLLVPPGDSTALATAVAELLQDVELRRRLVAGGLQAASRFDPAVHTAAIAALYDEVLA